MTWRANEEDYDETVAQVTLRVQRGMRRVLEGNESEKSRQESVTLGVVPQCSNPLAQIWVHVANVTVKVFKSPPRLDPPPPPATLGPSRPPVIPSATENQ